MSAMEKSDAGRDYELVVILPPTVAPEEVPAAIERITGMITAQGGEVAATDRWGRKKLAYPIRHFTEGEYFLTTFKMDPTSVPQIEGNLRLSQEVIRHLLVKCEEAERVEKGESDGGPEQSDDNR